MLLHSYCLGLIIILIILFSHIYKIDPSF